MRTPANVAGHPIHPMLVTLPIGLWVFSFVCDLIFVFGSGAPQWNVVALYTMGGGIVGALIAAVPGLIDLLSLPAELRKTALAHMAINLSIVAIYVVNFWLRLQTPAASGLVWLSALTVAMLLVSGWLGGKMVYLSGVAVSAGDPTQERRTSKHSVGDAHPAGE
ncbi:MAG TPA: DUF2231 domain-containing protein [Casimicrobiaceae bacterium]|nr:DUF2231 domain-containing protein [Casimicrobiaceae bacterium]